MMATDYKTLKEAFVSDQTGSSILHVNLISAAALASIALHHTLSVRSPNPDNATLLQSWLVLILPLLLSQTLFASRPLLLTVLTSLPIALLTFFVPPRRKTPLPSNVNIPRRSPSPLPSPLPSPTKTRTNPYLTPPPSMSTSPVMSNDTTANLNSTLREGLTPAYGHLAIPVEPLPALSTYRAHMLLMTSIAILAVDFPIFPRALVKCESFGVSLMDIGVGSFVFAQGIVSAIPVLKDPTRLSASVAQKVWRATKKVAPVLVIGLVRVVLVKGTEYPEHVSEYGVHWNFFVTLALLPIMEVFIHPLIANVSVVFLGCTIAVVHQILLSTTGLQSYVLFAPRMDMISMNKEGLASITGYLAIHLLGFSLGTVILPPSPSDFRRRQNLLQKTLMASWDKLHLKKHGKSGASAGGGRKDDKTAIELGAYAMMYWCLLLLVYNPLFGVGGGVSRRLVNLPYILWVAAYNTSFLLGYFLLDMFFYPPEPGSKFASSSPGLSSSQSLSNLQPPMSLFRNTPRVEDEPSRKGPVLLEAINKNGLVFFLLANVLTGLTNLSIQTMYASDAIAILMLILYSIAVSGVAWAFRDRRLIQL